METVVGLFATRSAAERGVAALRALNIPQSRINVLAPDSSLRELESVPTSDTEQPGMGKALGAVVGGAVGASAGAVAPLLIPGIGPVVALGTVAMAILGALGAVGGAKVGGEVEHALDNGLPKDELFFYEDALRRGHVVVIALVDEDRADAARRALRDSGAEDIDTAREQWWIGIRDVERTAYDGNFAAEEKSFRHGFEAALYAELRGRTYAEVEAQLRARHGALCDQPAFRRGFERGGTYCQRFESGTSDRPKEMRRA